MPGSFTMKNDVIRFFAVALVSALVVPITADYQFELRLISYVNPRGLTADMQCCEPESVLPDDTCFFINTCDTQINARLLNFNQLNRQLGGNIVLGPYEDMNTITFPPCDMTSNMNNPLVFTFATSTFSPGETIRISFDISDVDVNIISGLVSTVDIATNMIFEIGQIPGTNPSFSQMQTLGAPLLTDLSMEFSYRLICTENTCGSDCSQTTNCQPFPDACEVDVACQTVTCSNGGTCAMGLCTCTERYTGTTCDQLISPPSTTARTPPPPPPRTIIPPPTETPSTPSSPPTPESERTAPSNPTNTTPGLTESTVGAGPDPLPSAAGSFNTNRVLTLLLIFYNFVLLFM